MNNKEEIPHERKSCYDCAHLIARVNWWCGNKEAVKARGTAIPGVIHCPYWSPDYKMIPQEKKPYVMPRWLGSLIGMIVSAVLLWGNQVLRFLNSLIQ